MNNWYDMVKGAARARFAATSWPAVTEEEWRRSDLSKLGLDSFLGAVGRADFELEPGGVEGPRLLSAQEWLSALPTDAAARAKERLTRTLEAADRISSWNLAESEAKVLEIPAGLRLTEPLVVDCRVSGAAHARLSVVAGPGAQADIVYRVAGDGAGADSDAKAAEVAAATPQRSGSALVDLALDISVGENARLRVFETHESDDSTIWFSDIRAGVGRSGYLRHLVAETSGRFVKSRVECDLEGPGADAELDGLFHGPRGRHLDLRTVQRHLSPRATSRSLYKGALETGGRSVFQGLIEVAKDASGTDAFLANRNLLLGEGARADSIPTLRIGNNDVRCSHGSTTGRLSAAELFYLQSRGFDTDAAKELLVMGFFTELLDSAPARFAEPLVARLAKAIGGQSPVGTAAARAA